MKKVPFLSVFVALLGAAFIATSGAAGIAGNVQNAGPVAVPTLSLKWTYDTGG